MTKRRAEGFTLVELLIVVAIIGVVSAITVPGVLRARLSANEAAAVASLRVISSAEANYAATCGSGGYATDLADLVKPPGSTDHGFLSPDLGTNGVEKSGYTLTLEKNAGSGIVDVLLLSCNGAAEPRASAFFASAVPTWPGQTGVRYFATDTPGAIYMDGAAIANPIPVGTETIR